MKLLSQKISAILLIFLVGTSVLAGIRIIDNGGGYAETLALSSIDTIEKLLPLAKRLSTELDLNQNENSLLENLIKLDRVKTKNIILEFSESEKKIQISDGPKELRITFPYKMLYEADGKIKSLNEISYLVYISLYYEYQNKDYETLKSLGIKLFQSLQSQSQSHYLDAHNFLSIKRVKVKNSPIKSLIAIQNDNNSETTYVTPALEKVLPCKTGTKASLVQFGLHQVNNNSLSATVVFSCADQVFKAQLLLPYSLGKAVDLHFDSAIVSRLSEEQKNCVNLLED